MSRGRFDRKPRQEQWKTEYFPFGGGFDQSSSALTVKPGRLLQCVNMEEVYGHQGYRFIKGYERFSGKASPSEATFYVLPFDAGDSDMPVAGTTINNAGAVTAVLVDTIIESGTLLAGNAVGYLVLWNVSGGAWANNDPIRTGATVFGAATDVSYEGTSTFDYYEDALRDTRNYVRSLIAAVPGAGAILGGCTWNDRVYVARNHTDNLSARIYKSSASGWTLVEAGLMPSTHYNFEAANFTGDSENIGLFCVNGKDRLFRILEDDTIENASAIWGSEGTDGASRTIGTGAKTFMISESARDWVAGDELTVWLNGDCTTYFAGTVTTYTEGTGQLDMNITSVGGSGAHTGWFIGRTDFSDKPFGLTEHKNHLFLAYPNGQLQTTDLGEWSTATSTASLFGIGQEIGGLVSLKGEALGVFCSGKILVIEGSSATDWSQRAYSKDYGALAGSLVINDGNPLFLSPKGMASLAATQNFGSFEASIFSKAFRKTLDAKRSSVIGARMAYGNVQYRMYFDDGGCLRMTFLAGAAGTIDERTVSVTYSEYDDIPVKTWGGPINGQERMFFGTSDGYVYEEDAGTSFDGGEILYAIRLPDASLKSPGMDKQFFKLEVEISKIEPAAVTFYFRTTFDYDDGESHYGGGSVDVGLTGGLFDDAQFDSFAFAPIVQRLESEIDGIGRSVGLLLWAESDMVAPVSMQGAMYYFVPLGLKR